MKSLHDTMEKFYNAFDIKQVDELVDKTILVTGASGLIGSNLLTALDFLNTKHNLNLKLIGIVRSGVEAWMPRGEHITYQTIDLSSEQLPSDISFDYLIHCATYGQPKKFLEQPHETVTLNIEVLFYLLGLAEKQHATFVYLSSAEIYGEADEKHQPTEESYFGYVNTLSERAIYAESKRLAETICFLYSKKLNVKIARLLICYGPGVKIEDQRVYSEFIKKAQKNGEIIMMDEGKAERSLCFVADAVEMLLNIMLSSKELVYNVAGNGSVSIKGLAEIIAKINNAKVSSTINKREIGGTPQRSMLSNGRYTQEFSKKTFVSLEEGMGATSEWLKNLS